MQLHQNKSMTKALYLPFKRLAATASKAKPAEANDNESNCFNHREGFNQSEAGKIKP